MNGPIIDLAFIMRNQARGLYDKYFKISRNLNDHDYMDSFIGVEKWLYTTQPVPGVLFHQIISEDYKINHLVNGELVVRNKMMNLQEIDIPLLCITAKKDDLVSPESTLAVMEHVASKDISTMEIPGGHVGLCISKRAHEDLWPKVASWIISRTHDNKNTTQNS